MDYQSTILAIRLVQHKMHDRQGLHVVHPRHRAPARRCWWAHLHWTERFGLLQKAGGHEEESTGVWRRKEITHIMQHENEFGKDILHSRPLHSEVEARGQLGFSSDLSELQDKLNLHNLVMQDTGPITLCIHYSVTYRVQWYNKNCTSKGSLRTSF